MKRNNRIFRSQNYEYMYVNVIFICCFTTLLTMFGSSLPPVACRRAHVLHTFFVFAYMWWCPTHIALCGCFLSMLPVFLDCPFLIAPSVFTNVYLFIDNTCRRGYLNILKLKHFLYTGI
jgi:hypothetical protein